MNERKNTPFQYKGLTVDYLRGEYRADAYTYEQISSTTLAGIKKAINQRLKNKH